MMAWRQAQRDGLLSFEHIKKDILSGFIVAIISLPLSMAFAVASGVRPEYGIYTAITAGFIVAIFGGSKVQVAGPTGAFVVILMGITAKYGFVGLQISTVMAGAILVCMGLAKLGSFIKFIPLSVVIGFTSGIAVVILTNEIPSFFGLTLTFGIDDGFGRRILRILSSLPELNVHTSMLACLALALVMITPKIKYLKKIPAPLTAMLAATACQVGFQYSDVATLGSVFGTLPRGLPPITIPTINYSTIIQLLGPAVSIAMLGSIESLLSATMADEMLRKGHHNSNQELIGQGIANIVAPFLGGFAATGALARTATNIRGGGKSPVAAIANCIFLVLIVAIFSPLAKYVPLCALSAILFSVAFHMCNVQRFISTIKRSPTEDIVILLSTFFLTIFADLIMAVSVGVMLSILFFFRLMYRSVYIDLQSSSKAIAELSLKDIKGTFLNETMVFEFNGPFFFGVTEKLNAIFENPNIKNPRNVIFRLRYVPFMDITGLENLENLMIDYKKLGVKFYLCEANSMLSRKLAKAGLLKRIEGKRIYNEFYEIFTTNLQEFSNSSQISEAQDYSSGLISSFDESRRLANEVY